MLGWVKQHRSKLAVLFALLVIVTVFALLLIFIKPNSHIVYFDLKSTHQSFSEQLSKRTDIPDIEKEGIARRFGQSIEAITQAYAKKHKVIVLVKPAVIAGGRDITRELQQAILQRMQQDG